MRRTVRTAALTTVLALSVLLLGATAAFAQYPPDTDFGVTCQPSSPQPGASVSCTVVGAFAGEGLTVSAGEDGADSFYEESMTADGQGEASFGFEVPTDVQGAVIVRVAGDQSGEATTTLTAAADDEADDGDDVEPDEVADDDALPVTGGQLAMLSVLGLGLVSTGGLALRKRRPTRA